MMLLMLKKETQTSSKLVYLVAMEVRVYFHPEIITQFGDVITQYKAWHHYVTEKNQVEVDEFKFPQSQS